MRAVVFEKFQTFPSLTEVDRPTPGPGEVLLKIAGAGACHSDVAVYREFTADSPASIPPPFVLGHENAGWVEELGPGVTGFEKGDAYLVYGPIGAATARPARAARTRTARTRRPCRTSPSASAVTAGWRST